MVRRTVTLDADAVDSAMELAGGNFSAYVNEALMRRVRLDRLRAMLDEHERRQGPIDPAIVAQVREELRQLEER